MICIHKHVYIYICTVYPCPFQDLAVSYTMTSMTLLPLRDHQEQSCRATSGCLWVRRSGVNGAEWDQTSLKTLQKDIWWLRSADFKWKWQWSICLQKIGFWINFNRQFQQKMTHSCPKRMVNVNNNNNNNNNNNKSGCGGSIEECHVIVKHVHTESVLTVSRDCDIWIYMGISWNRAAPSHHPNFSRDFSNKNHPLRFWGTHILVGKPPSLMTIVMVLVAWTRKSAEWGGGSFGRYLEPDL